MVQAGGGGSDQGTAESEDTPMHPDLEESLREQFGRNAELTINHYTDHIDVRVVPHDIAATLEERHPGFAVTPYSGFRMTLKPREEKSNDAEP